MALNLKEPIHNYQKGENKRAYHYFTMYKKFHGTLADFQRHLEKLWRENGENLTEIFYAYDIQKGQAPTYAILEKWHRLFEWKKRKQAFEDEEEEKIVAAIRKEYVDGLTKDYRQTAKFKELNLEAAISESEAGKLTPNGAEARATANSKLQADMRTSAGLDSSITKVKTDLNGDLNVEGNMDVRHHNISEDLILNPKYAELTRQLREDVLNDRSGRD